VTSLQIGCLVLAVLALALALAFGVFRIKRPAQPESLAETPKPTVSVLTTISTRSLASRGAVTPVAPATPDEPAEELNARFEAMHRLQMLALGMKMLDQPSDAPADPEITSKVRSVLSNITDKPNYAPRRPLLLPKLLRAMNNDDVSRRELADIIASDPGLTAGLLGLANSPFYRITPVPIESLDHAIAVLGIEGMRSLVAAALMQPVFKASDSGFPTFGDITWQHTLCSATASESHANMLESSDPFAAQLLALMMGIATIVVFRVTIDECQSRHMQPWPRTLMDLIDSEAAPVARQIANSWQLSERVDAALADQSAPQGAKMSSLGRSVQFGRFLGALAVLNEHQIIDEAAVEAALHSGGEMAESYLRLWARRPVIAKNPGR